MTSEPRCARCNYTAYEHRDHAHKPYPTCPFGDCDKFEEATGE